MKYGDRAHGTLLLENRIQYSSGPSFTRSNATSTIPPGSTTYTSQGVPRASHGENSSPLAILSMSSHL